MSNWQQYDYDKDGYLESGKELRDWSAADQKETQAWLTEFHEDMDEAKEALEGISVDLFWEGTQQGAHYLILAGQGLSDTAYLISYAAEVIGWLGTAFRWLGYLVPAASAVADLLDKVEDVSQEKALKAQFVALSVALDGLKLASAGWTAKMEGRITQQAWDTALEVINGAVELGQSITDVLFDD